MSKNDNYETPQYLADWAVKYAKSLLHFVDNPFLIEPGCGPIAPFASAGIMNGCDAIAIENRKIFDHNICTPFDKIPNLYTFKTKYEFHQEVDFLESNPWDKTGVFDIIATNPPFSKALPFIWKSFDLLHPHGVMVYLLKLPFLASKSRIKLFSERPPYEVWVIQRRPSFTYDGNTDKTEYAFYIWFGKERTKYIRKYGHTETHLKWLDNKKIEQEWLGSTESLVNLL